MGWTLTELGNRCILTILGEVQKYNTLLSLFGTEGGGGQPPFGILLAYLLVN